MLVVTYRDGRTGSVSDSSRNSRDSPHGRSIALPPRSDSGHNRCSVHNLKHDDPTFLSDVPEEVEMSRATVLRANNSWPPHVTCHVRTRMKQKQVPLSATYN